MPRASASESFWREFGLQSLELCPRALHYGGGRRGHLLEREGRRLGVCGVAVAMLKPPAHVVQLFERATRAREGHLIVLVDGVIADASDEGETPRDVLADGLAERLLLREVREVLLVWLRQILGGVDPLREQLGGAPGVGGGGPGIGS